MVLPPWIRLVVACGFVLWLGYDLGGWPFRAVLAVLAALWAAWALLSIVGEE